MEVVIEELKNELVWKDQEFAEMREELEKLRKETDPMMKALKEEKAKRQSLEANKTKYVMLKELMANAEPIQENTFLDMVREKDKNRNTSNNFANQILQQ